MAGIATRYVTENELNTEISIEELSKYAPALNILLTDKEYSKQYEDEGIHYPDHFSLESVKERLDMYDVSKAPGLQALVDIMIMFCIRPAKIKTLYISNEGIQDAISFRQLRDPEKFRVLWFNTFLKKDEFLPEIGKPLLLSSLRKLGAVFTVVSHDAKNLSEAMTIASKALHHSSENHAPPAKNYTIVNYWLRGEPYN
ncbi:hypothetical protein GLOIN_2v1765707 [Rhizophagus clarus]|uniref:Uncharacterized protein n=1 Tax=Rhizophagus clarus TaxID=94130 RepID=A0A8H3M541_9GLOM|nr:hypothetical protein GLOIN_2v1765707 [Rhizophagus clarus]